MSAPYGTPTAPLGSVVELKVGGEGAAAVPVPESESVCGLPARLLPLMLSVALRTPVFKGRKMIAIVQLDPAATGPPAVGQVVPAGKIGKSAAFVPIMLIEIRLSVPVPAVTLIVTVWGALEV